MVSLLLTAVLAADGDVQVPGVEPVQVVEVSDGADAVPGSLVATNDGFILAWTWRSPAASACYLTRLTPAGHSVARVRVEADSCEGLRAAWSGSGLGVAFQYRVPPRIDDVPSRGGFRRYDAALAPVGPLVELVSQPAQVGGSIVWNAKAREWAVGWAAFSPRPGTAKLARIAEDGTRLEDVQLAPGRPLGEGWTVPLVDALAPSGAGYVAALSPPLRLVAFDGRAVKDVVRLDDDGHGAALLTNDAATRVLWHARGSTVLRAAKVVGGAVKEKTLVRELSTDLGTGWPSLHCPAAPRVLWQEHQQDGTASRLHVSGLGGKRPARVGPVDDTLGRQRFPVGLCTPQGLIVVFGRFDEVEKRDRLFLVRVP
ncbi:MAG: hypothetical protein JNJ54_36005 [Myxococcaceae bacterium]|nr:hypothetical protein [Myxococcaceae bacterium]